MQLVSSIQKDPQMTGNYLMEFFDIRDAARIRAMAPKSVGLKHVDVDICGMPNSVCTRICMEAVFEQAGLADSIVKFHAKQGSPCGKVTVTLLGENAATQCTKHFQGRQWDPSGALVCVAILCVRSPPQAKAAAPMRLQTVKKASDVEAPQQAPSEAAATKAVKASDSMMLPPGLEYFSSSDFSSSLFAAFDVASAETVKHSRDTEQESSTDAGTSDADGEHDEECLVDDRAVTACF